MAGILESKIRQVAQEQKQADEDFSFGGLAESTAAGAGVGLLFGNPVGGAIGGALGYIVEKMGTKGFRELGASPEWAELGGLGLSLLTPAGVVSKTEKLLKLSKTFDRLARIAAAGASTGYLAYTIPEEEDAGKQAALLGVPLGIGLQVMLHDQGLADKVIKMLAPKLAGLESKWLGGIGIAEISHAEATELSKKLGREIKPGKLLFPREVAELAAMESRGAQLKMEQIASDLYKAGVQPGSDLAAELSTKARAGDINPDLITDPKLRSAIKAVIDMNEQLKDDLVAADFVVPHALDAFHQQIGKYYKLYLPAFVEKEDDGKLAKLLKMYEGEEGIKKVRGRATLLRGKKRKLPKLARHLKSGDTYVDSKGRAWAVVKEGRHKYILRDLGVDEATAIGWQPDFARDYAVLVHEQAKLRRKAYTLKWISALGQYHGLVADSKLTDSFVKVPNKIRNGIFKEFGALNGKWVHKDVWDAVQQYFRIEYHMLDMGVLAPWARLNQEFKKYFLGLRPKSYVNAAIGNAMIALMHGDNPLRLLKYAATAPEGIKKLAAKYGISTESYMLDLMKRIPKAPPKHLKDMPLGETLWRMTEWAGKLGDKAISQYGKIDQYFKLGLFSKLVSEGENPAKAAIVAQKAFVSYDLLPKKVLTIRDTVMPFVSFFYRAYPMLAELALRNPHRALTIAAEIQFLQQLGYQETYGKKWRKGRAFEQVAAPAYAKTSIAGIGADYIRVPKIGPFPGGLMSSAMMPWNLPFSWPAKEEGQTIAAFVNQSPIIRFLAGIVVGADPSTGSNVYTTAGPGRPLMSAMAYAYKQLSPTYTTTKYLGNWLAAEGRFDPIIAFFNLYGTDLRGVGVSGWNMLWNELLPAIRRIDPSYEYEKAYYRLRSAWKKHRKALLRAYWKGGNVATIAKQEEGFARATEEFQQQAGILTELFNASM